MTGSEEALANTNRRVPAYDDAIEDIVFYVDFGDAVFCTRCQTPPPRRYSQAIWTKITTATDTTNIKHIFESVVAIIAQENMKAYDNMGGGL